jgi:hypothetical protein
MGYPTGGNFWSDYNGVDEFSGENQDEPGSDGIGDTPHKINDKLIDNYPMMEPWQPVKRAIPSANLLTVAFCFLVLAVLSVVFKRKY